MIKYVVKFKGNVKWNKEEIKQGE